MSSPKLVVFDCDGTLIDSAHVIVRTMQQVFERAGEEVPSPASIRKTIGLPLASAIAHLLPDRSADHHHALADGYREINWGNMQEAGLDEPLFDGCREVLDHLHAQPDLILAVATGKGRRGLNHSLESNGLIEHFTILKTADDGPSKPDPKILVDTMTQMGCSPLQTVVIGDTIFDIGMAVNAKAHALGVSWGYHPTEQLRQAGAFAVVDKFDEIPSVLAELWGAEE